MVMELANMYLAKWIWISAFFSHAVHFGGCVCVKKNESTNIWLVGYWIEFITIIIKCIELWITKREIKNQNYRIIYQLWCLLNLYECVCLCSIENGSSKCFLHRGQHYVAWSDQKFYGFSSSSGRVSFFLLLLFRYRFFTFSFYSSTILRVCDCYWFGMYSIEFIKQEKQPNRWVHQQQLNWSTHSMASFNLLLSTF